MPDPESEQYRNQVQTRVQGLLSGNQPRDPHLSTASTGRLILEGVVEQVKIYRLHKEEKAREAKELEKKERGMGRRSHGGERHRDGSRERHRHRHSSGQRQGRHRSKERGRDQSRDRHRERSNGRDRSQQQRAEEDIPDPVTEGPPDNNPRYMTTGGTGPPGTLPADCRAAEQRLRSRSRSRRRGASPRLGRAALPRSPAQRRVGPDGATPFGELPKKAAGVGLAAHFFNTYRHIKAEHDAGHRSRGVLEKTVDGWRRMNTGGERPREPEKLRKEHRGRNDTRRQDHGQSTDSHSRRDNSRRRGDTDGCSDGVRHEAKNRNRDRGRGDGRPRDIDRAIDPIDRDKEPPAHPHASNQPQGRSTPYPPRGMSPERPPSGYAHLPHRPLHAPSPPPLIRHAEPNSRTQSPPAIRVPDAAPSSSGNEPFGWPPTPSSFEPQQRSASSPYPDTPGEPSSPPVVPMPQSISMPPPPPPPPPSRLPKITPARDALLDEISSGGFKLRKVRKPEEGDQGRAAAYQATSHSRNVEDGERGQASNRTWSDVGSNDGDDDNETQRRKALKQTLGAQIAEGLAARMGRVSPSQSSCLTKDVQLIPVCRRGTLANIDEEARSDDLIDGGNPMSRYRGASFNRDGVFSNVAVRAGTPSWGWGELATGRTEPNPVGRRSA